MASFLLTAEIGSAAGVTSHPPQLLSIDTAGKVTDDILELFKELEFKLHYFVHSLQRDTKGVFDVSPDEEYSTKNILHCVR